MARRRGNKEGSIYQDASGRWRAAIHVGWRNDGKRARKVFSGKTRDEVAKKLMRALNAVDIGMTLAPDRQTVGQYLQHWLEHVAAKHVRPKTLRTYKDITEDHLVPALGRIPLIKLSPQKIREFMSTKLAETKKGSHETSYSPRSVKHMRDTLRAALNVAVRDGLLTRNPAALVDPPRDTKRREPTVLGPDQALLFLAAAERSRLQALFSVTLALGLREGEILGLRWEDIDLERGTLVVRYQLQRVDGKLKLVEPKTKRSCRVIALPSIAVAALRSHQMRQEEERIAAGERWEDSKMVFTTGIGTMLDARNMLREFYKIVRDPKNSLVQIRFHDLRHSAATLLLAQGVHPRVVMDLLGHSSIALTMDTYSHVIPALQRQAATQMDAILTPAATRAATDTPVRLVN